MGKWALHATTKRKLGRISKEGIKPRPFWESKDFIRAPHKLIPKLVRKKSFRVPVKSCIIDPDNREAVVSSVYNALRAATTHATGFFGSARTEFKLSKLAILVTPVEKAEISNERKISFWVRTSRNKKTRHFGSEIIEAESRTGPGRTIEISLDSVNVPAEKNRHWLQTNEIIANKVADKIILEIKKIEKK